VIYALPGASFEAVTDFGTDGLAGTLGVRVIDNVGNEVIARTTAGIAEGPITSGIYQVTLTAPALAGQYSVVWDDADDHWAADDLVVTSDSPITVPSTPAGTELGPCTSWISGDDLVACGVEATSDGADLDYWAQVASELMFTLSGRRFSGLCGPITVRPCRKACGCGWQVLSRGHLVQWRDDYASWFCDGDSCGCMGESTIELWYPARSVSEVMIDGAVVDPTSYRIIRDRYLQRLDDPGPPVEHRVWPSCQNVTLDDTEDGTFSITYTYGRYPPESGKLAAAQLAKELLKECSGEACALPKGTTRVTRQGVTVERPAFTAWVKGTGWHTGMPLVDAFLTSFNPSGLQRRPVIWSPASAERFPQPV
jgi:hypothetical protein